jgi:hypothetical protein
MEKEKIIRRFTDKFTKQQNEDREIFMCFVFVNGVYLSYNIRFIRVFYFRRLRKDRYHAFLRWRYVVIKVANLDRR